MQEIAPNYVKVVARKARDAAREILERRPREAIAVACLSDRHVEERFEIARLDHQILFVETAEES